MATIIRSSLCYESDSRYTKHYQQLWRYHNHVSGLMPLTNSYLTTILVHMLWHSGEFHLLAPLALLFHFAKTKWIQHVWLFSVNWSDTFAYTDLFVYQGYREMRPCDTNNRIPVMYVLLWTGLTRYCTEALTNFADSSRFDQFLQNWHYETNCRKIYSI